MLENCTLRSEDIMALQEVRGLIIDMDGVLWLGDIPLPGLQEFFHVLRVRGLKFVLATNNSAQLGESAFADAWTRAGTESYKAIVAEILASSNAASKVSHNQ